MAYSQWQACQLVLANLLAKSYPGLQLDPSEFNFFSNTYIVNKFFEPLQNRPINLFHRSPDGAELGSIAGISMDHESKKLSAHFFEGGNDRCQGGYVEVMGMASRKEIALSQASTLYALLNPLDQLLRRSDEHVRTTFPDWQAEETISNNPSECVGRLIGVFDHVTEIASVTAVAVDLDALLRQSRNTTEACVSDAIVRAKAKGSITSGSFTVYGLNHWNDILNYVHRRCGVDKTFNPINSGI